MQLEVYCTTFLLKFRVYVSPDFHSNRVGCVSSPRVQNLMLIIPVNKFSEYHVDKEVSDVGTQVANSCSVII
jgi:hypothetical protein